MTLDPLISSPLWGDAPDLLVALLEPAFGEVLRHFPPHYGDGEVSLVFSSDADVAPLNQDYRGKVGPTNVLSFPQQRMKDGVFLVPPLTPAILLWGDIVLAHETINREAHAQHKSFENHLTHLCIHGFLHLLGFDHEVDEEAQRMENLEIKILQNLGIANPYQLTQDTP